MIAEVLQRWLDEILHRRCTDGIRSDAEDKAFQQRLEAVDTTIKQVKETQDRVSSELPGRDVIEELRAYQAEMAAKRRQQSVWHHRHE